MNQRELVLLPFPFSDLSGRKVRPALVVSNDNFNKNSDDVIVCAVTSNITRSNYSVLIIQKNLEEGKLFVKSIIKIENILKIKKSLVLKKIGRINKSTFSKVKEKINEIIK